MKILIIDDEPKIRNGLSNLLTRREGWEVAGAYENAADALKYLAVNQVDVMITDIKMPEISGLELIARIRERDKKTAIIILSGYSNFQFAPVSYTHLDVYKRQNMECAVRTVFEHKTSVDIWQTDIFAIFIVNSFSQESSFFFCHSNSIVYDNKVNSFVS